MLDFFNKIQAVRSQAIKLYEAIETEYRPQNSYVVYSPMNIHAGTEGESSKPWHRHGYELARSALLLISDNSRNYEDFLYQSFANIEQFQSELAAGEDDKGFPKILDKFNAARIALVENCKELILDIARFKSRKENVTQLSLISHFAEQLVDENLFGCTPAFFAMVESKARERDSEEIKRQKHNLPYWFDLFDSFSELVTPRSCLINTENMTSVIVLGDRASKLERFLLCKLTIEDISALKEAVTKKYQLLQDSKVSSVVVSERPTPIIHAFKAVAVIAASAVPEKFANSIPDAKNDNKTKSTEDGITTKRKYIK